MVARHERRRRLLTDESLLGTQDSAPIRLADAAGEAGAGATYSAAAKASCQRPLYSLFPTRYRAIAAVVIAAGLGIALIACLHVWSPLPAEALEVEQLDTLRIDSQRNLSLWLAASLLGAASLAALFIHSLRRHRIDDYHGRYRVWIWVALVCQIASVLEVSGIGQVARAACGRLADFGSASESLLWTGALALVLTAIGLRLLIELRKSRLAVAMLVLAGGCFASAAAVYHDWPLDLIDAYRPLIGRGTWLSGYVLLLTSFLFYGRHVLEEIYGAAALATTKSAKRKSTQEDSKPAGKTRPALHVRTDLDPVDKAPAAASKAAEKPKKNSSSESEDPAEPMPQLRLATSSHKPTAVSSAADDDDEQEQEQASETRGLSRAERRRMKRQAKLAS